MQGLVVVGIDPKGPAAASNARVGDVVLQVGGNPVSDAAAFTATLESQRPGDSIALDVKDAAGAPKRLELRVAASPRAIGLYEYGVLTNRVLLDLRARLADATDPFEQSVLRLNTAITLARLGDWAAAKAELERVQLAGRAGVGEGTVQYLLGLAAENLGNRPEAEAAFKAAAASESLLTEDGPPVKELAEARLAELAKR
jgi:hypothetical protein